MTEPETLAYETREDRGFKIKAIYLNDESRSARIELHKDGELHSSRTVPAYKIYNYSAHLQDIVDDVIYHAQK